MSLELLCAKHCFQHSCVLTQTSQQSYTYTITNPVLTAGKMRHSTVTQGHSSGHPARKWGARSEPRWSRSKCRLLSRQCAASQAMRRCLAWSLAHKHGYTTVAISIIIINVFLLLLPLLLLLLLFTSKSCPQALGSHGPGPADPHREGMLASPSLAAEVTYERRMSLEFGRLGG